MACALLQASTATGAFLGRIRDWGLGGCFALSQQVFFNGCGAVRLRAGVGGGAGGEHRRLRLFRDPRGAGGGTGGVLAGPLPACLPHPRTAKIPVFQGEESSWII